MLQRTAHIFAPSLISWDLRDHRSFRVFFFFIVGRFFGILDSAHIFVARYQGTMCRDMSFFVTGSSGILILRKVLSWGPKQGRKSSWTLKVFSFKIQTGLASVHYSSVPYSPVCLERWFSSVRGTGDKGFISVRSVQFACLIRSAASSFSSVRGSRAKCLHSVRSLQFIQFHSRTFPFLIFTTLNASSAAVVLFTRLTYIPACCTK